MGGYTDAFGLDLGLGKGLIIPAGLHSARKKKELKKNLGNLVQLG